MHILGSDAVLATVLDLPKPGGCGKGWPGYSGGAGACEVGLISVGVRRRSDLPSRA